MATNGKKTKPGVNPESREKQLVNHAMALAEKQLLEGTASPSVINHFLKLGSSKLELENEVLRSQAKLYQAKIEELEKRQNDKELHEEALKAMKRYSGDE